MSETNSNYIDLPSTSEALAMYERMQLIRQTETRLGKDFREGKLIAGVHLYIGQEAIAVGICQNLTDQDWIASNHRGHGHFLAKGGELNSMMAEIHAKVTGVCKGMGGTMHVADFSKGILGANGIVGGGISLICGAAFACSLQDEGKVAISFFGDGASTQGVFSEALNLCALWRLPMIFVCENNLYSEFSRSDTVVAGKIVDRGAPYGSPSVTIDGNEVIAMWNAARIAIKRARAGEGATLIEAFTYRMAGHVEAETGFLQGAKYRTEQEVMDWQEKDPILRFAHHLTSDFNISNATLEEIDLRVANAVLEAVKFAEESPIPPEEQAFQHMFA